MFVTNNTIKKNQYKHITKEDRYVIKALYDQKDSNGKRIYSNADIARYLGVHRSTISRELKRVKHKIYVKTGRIKTMPYNAEYAWENYLFKRGLYNGEYKLRKYKTMAKFIEDKIKKGKWSPDVIVSYMKTHHYFEKKVFVKYLHQPFIMPLDTTLLMLN